MDLSVECTKAMGAVYVIIRTDALSKDEPRTLWEALSLAVRARFRYRQRASLIPVSHLEFIMAVAAVPRGYHTVTPYLLVRGATRAIEFYKKAFGATDCHAM